MNEEQNKNTEINPVEEPVVTEAPVNAEDSIEIPENNNEFKGEDTPVDMNTEVNNETPEQEEQLEKITIEDTEGNAMECEVLYEFTSEETKKHYMIYTANKEDENGNVAIYASIVDESGEQPTLKSLEDEKDEKLIQNVLNDIKKQAESQ
ncbi:MAG: DUF1292 domain-containing protein [Bacilli bacterium]